MSSSGADFRKLQEQTEQSRLGLLRSDMELLHTLGELVEIELKLGNREHALQTFARASKGYEDMCRIFERRNQWDAETTKEITDKLAGLREELDQLQRLIHSTGQGR